MASSTISASSTAFFCFPSYVLLPTSVLKGLEDVAIAAIVSSSVDGDLFNTRASKLPLVDIASGDVILAPLFTTTDSAVINADTLAQGPIMYI